MTRDCRELLASAVMLTVISWTKVLLWTSGRANRTESEFEGISTSVCVLDMKQNAIRAIPNAN